MSFGSRIKELRKELNISQCDFGNKIGVTGTTISQYESDLRFPDKDTLVKICIFLNVSADYLLELSNTKETIKEDNSIIINENDYSDEKYEVLKVMVRALRNRE